MPVDRQMVGGAEAPKPSHCHRGVGAEALISPWCHLEPVKRKVQEEEKEEEQKSKQEEEKKGEGGEMKKKEEKNKMF